MVRFSNASGKPEAHDGERNGGGMAVKLRPPGGQEWDVIGVGPPVFVARTVEDFLELLQLRKPDPETGQPDMAALGEYLGRHPEAVSSRCNPTLGAEPAASYVTVPYHSPHAFALLDARRQPHLGPLALAPRGPRGAHLRRRGSARGRHYLREELVDRLQRAPRRWSSSSSSRRRRTR